MKRPILLLVMTAAVALFPDAAVRSEGNAARPAAGAVEGVVAVDLPEPPPGSATRGAERPDLRRSGPHVVYLERIGGELPFPVPEAHPSISQRDARFRPDFLAIVAGQTVDMPNDDDITHNVFSYSPPRKFDLGLYPKGEKRSVTFDVPGVVNIYCSIHESMNGQILVLPNPHYAVLAAPGRWRIEDVPEGEYTLRTWSRRLPPLERRIRVRAGETLRQTLVLPGRLPEEDEE